MFCQFKPWLLPALVELLHVEFPCSITDVDQFFKNKQLLKSLIKRDY